MDIETIQINKVNVAVGDVIIVKTPSDYSSRRARSVYDLFRRCFPDNQCVVIPKECDIHICQRVEQELVPATQEELLEFFDIHKREMVEDDD